MSAWNLTDDEWHALSSVLTVPAGASPRRGRPRATDARRIAEVCLYRHYHAHALVNRSFGWNSLPAELGVSPSTANRRFREWTGSGAWARFWDALTRLRSPQPVTLPRSHEHDSFAHGSPIQFLIAEFERAYDFFNDRFLGGSLRRDVVIAVERPHRRRSGYFCASQWRRGDVVLGHLAICTNVLGQGADEALAVLLHEMVHQRNHQVGLDDCDARTQYHNSHFRDVATVFGLECAKRSPRVGYGMTTLAPRAIEAIRDFHPDESLFGWSADASEHAR